MKKFSTLILTLVLSFNVLAGTRVQEIEALADQYQYALTVDWDQQDQAALDLINAEFFQRTSDLLVEGGLTEDDLRQLALKRVGSSARLESLLTQLKFLDANDPRSLSEALKEISKHTQRTGANWSSMGATEALGGVAVVALFCWMIVSVSK